MNEISSEPHGGLVDDIHEMWNGRFQLLEMHHGYIQWLFPVFENAGMNFDSSPLTKGGAALIRANAEASQRVIKSYRLMLNFYGFTLADEKTGKLAHDPEIFHERIGHLNTSPHNWLRISRIITSLGELGFRRYKAPFLEALKAEIDAGMLSNARRSYEDFWCKLLDEESAWYKQKTLESPEDRDEGCLFAAGGPLA